MPPKPVRLRVHDRPDIQPTPDRRFGVRRVQVAVQDQRRHGGAVSLFRRRAVFVRETVRIVYHQPVYEPLVLRHRHAVEQSGYGSLQFFFACTDTGFVGILKIAFDRPGHHRLWPQHHHIVEGHKAHIGMIDHIPNHFRRHFDQSGVVT